MVKPYVEVEELIVWNILAKVKSLFFDQNQSYYQSSFLSVWLDGQSSGCYKWNKCK